MFIFLIFIDSLIFNEGKDCLSNPDWTVWKNFQRCTMIPVRMDMKKRDLFFFCFMNLRTDG